MVVRLLVLVVLAAVAYVAWDQGRTINESHVHQYYERQMAAIRNFDHEAMCGDIAGDFSTSVTTYVRGRNMGKTMYDGDTTCRMTRDMFENMRNLSARSRGMLALDVRVDVGAIRIEPGGRTATVESTTTVKMGEILVTRSRGSERLSRSLWRVRSHGGDGQAWTYL